MGSRHTANLHVRNSQKHVIQKKTILTQLDSDMRGFRQIEVRNEDEDEDEEVEEKERKLGRLGLGVSRAQQETNVFSSS